MSTEFAATFLINHLLLNKLPSYGITDRKLVWFTDYLFLRKQSAEVNGALSNAYPVYTGVPQGSILDPLLFLLHMNDIGGCLNIPRSSPMRTNNELFQLRVRSVNNGTESVRFKGPQLWQTLPETIRNSQSLC